MPATVWPAWRRRATLHLLNALRTALEDSLGVRFEGERGAAFFRSTLVQTLFYGVFFRLGVVVATVAAAGGRVQLA